MTRKRKGRNTKKNVLKVDFTNVDPGGKVPEGDYPVIVKEITAEESSAGNPYLKWVFTVADGRHKGKQLYHNTSLQPQALFNLRNTLEALGMEVPQSVVTLDLDNLIGATAAVAVEIETYQGKERSRVVEVFPLEELMEGDDEFEEEEYEDEDEVEEEPNPFKGHPDAEDDEEDEDEEYEDEEYEDEEYEDEDDDDDDDDDEEYELFTEEELQEMDDDELLEIAEDFEVDPVYTGKGKRKKLSRPRTIKAILEAQEEDEE